MTAVGYYACNAYTLLLAAFPRWQEAQGHSRNKVRTLVRHVAGYVLHPSQLCDIMHALEFFLLILVCFLWCLCISYLYTVHNLYRHKSEKPFMKIEGEWDNILMAKDRSGVSCMFTDYCLTCLLVDSSDV